MTTSPRTPARPHCCAISSTWIAGTATNATSTSTGIASTFGYATTPWTTSALGFTGKTEPENSVIRRLWNNRPPIAEESREAPMTATERGARKVRIALIAACVSRSSKCWIAVSVRPIGNSTSIAPGVARIDGSKPLERKTLIIEWFSGRTSAEKVAMSWAAAASASWPSRIDPIPRPWNSSVTERLISARTRCVRMYWAPPIIRPSSPPWRTSKVRWLSRSTSTILRASPRTSIACDQKRRRRVSGESPTR
jgi:hypothetical protein